MNHHEPWITIVDQVDQLTVKHLREPVGASTRATSFDTSASSQLAALKDSSRINVVNEWLMNVMNKHLG